MLTSENVFAVSRAGRDQPPLLAYVEEFRQVSILDGLASQANRNVAAVRSFLWREHVVRPEDLDVSKVRMHLSTLLRDCLSKKSVLNHLSSVSKFCEFLVEKGVVEVNPCRLVKRPKLEKPVGRYLSRQEQLLALRLADSSSSLYRCGQATIAVALQRAFM